MNDPDSSKSEVPSIIASPTGGVMTKEVGAITGDLEVATRPIDNGTIEVTVRYAGAEEWYTVEGSPIESGNAGSPSELHERIVEHLTMPGNIVEGNEGTTSLYGFFPTAD